MSGPFNQGVPSVPTVINASNVFVFGNTASGNALSVQQLGAGNVASFRTTTGSTALFVGANGNVGVGTTNTTSPLVVQTQPGLVSFLVTGQLNTERVRIQSSRSVGGTAVFQTFGSRGTQDAPTATLSGDELGYYQFGGYDGSDWQRASWITGRAEENWSITNRGSNMIFSTTPIASTTITERMRILGNGNVGIGTASPGQTLEIGCNNATGQHPLRLSNYNTGLNATKYIGMEFRGTDSFGTLKDCGQIRVIPNNQDWTDGAAMAFFARSGDTSSVERMRISTAGNVGIGAPSPPAKLWVSGVTGTSGSFGVFQADVSVNIGFVAVSNWGIIQVLGGGTSSSVGTTPYSLEIQTAGGALTLGSASAAVTVNSLAGTGNRAVYSTPGGVLTNSSSDQRLKSNVNAITYGLSTVSNLRPISYNWINTESLGSQVEIGFIAQEVQGLVPEVVGQNTNGMLSLDYQKLVPVLTKAIQELSTENTQLKSRLDSLEQRLAAAGL